MNKLDTEKKSIFKQILFYIKGGAFLVFFVGFIALMLYGIYLAGCGLFSISNDIWFNRLPIPAYFIIGGNIIIIVWSIYSGRSYRKKGKKN